MSWDADYVDFGPIARLVAESHFGDDAPPEVIDRAAGELGRLLAKTAAEFFGGEAWTPEGSHD